MKKSQESGMKTYRSALEFRRYVCNLPRFTYSKMTNIGSFSMQQPNNRTTLTCGSSDFITWKFYQIEIYFKWINKSNIYKCAKCIYTYKQYWQWQFSICTLFSLTGIYSAAVCLIDSNTEALKWKINSLGLSVGSLQSFSLLLAF